MHRKTRLLPSKLFLTLLFLCISCSPSLALIKVDMHNIPAYQDDGERKPLILACQRQLDRLSTLAPDEQIPFADDSYSALWLTQSMDHFIHILKTSSQQELAETIAHDFIVYQAGGRSGKPPHTVLFTGYYEPVFAGSLTKESPYLYPVYQVPTDLIVVRGKDGNGSTVGRRVAGQILPYWSRQQINEEQRCDNAIIAYLKDPIDAFVLQIQGSGKLKFPDGSLHSLHYAGSNGLPYNSIGKLLVDEGRMTLATTNMESIREYLNTHPDEINRIFNHNRRFIFFSWADNKNPKGSSGIELTPGRSIAIDNSSLPWHAIAFIDTERPLFKGNGLSHSTESLRRFVVAQDTGSAIQGSGRVDIFWGNGIQAERTASHMKQDGTLYFLVKKGYKQVHKK